MFANPLMASATIDRLVHRAVKIVIEGKSYRNGELRASLTGTAAALTGLAMRPDRAVARGCSTYHLARRRGRPYRPSWRDCSPGAGSQCAPKLADRAISALRHCWPSVTLSCHPSRSSSATTGRTRGARPAAPAVVGSRAASGSNQMTRSTRTRRSGLIQRSPRFTT